MNFELTNPQSKRGPKTGAAAISNGGDLGTLAQPSFLLETARPHWDRLTEVLSEMGLIGEADSFLVGLLANELAAYQSALAGIQEEGAVTLSSKGTETKSPHRRNLENSRDAILAMLKEVALTPSARKAFRRELHEARCTRDFENAAAVVALRR